jgi:hypothetical protein
MRRLTLALTLSLLGACAGAAEQARALSGFNAIDIRGPINLQVEAGKAHSVRVIGDDKFFKRVTTDVVNGKLRIDMDESHTSTSDNERVVVTVPQLQQFSGAGAGVAQLSNISGERFVVDYKGAGRLVISGKVKQLKLSAKGVGEVDTRNLVAQDADVDFKGVGSVKVHATDKLNADVKGIGELLYYGRPRVVNKTAGGLGSVSAGD